MAAVNGFSVVDFGDHHLATYRVPGTGIRLSLRKEVAPLLIGFAADFHREVQPLDPKSCWGHNYRKVRGARSWSFHAPGIAVDLNSSAHPMGRRNTFRPDQVKAIQALLGRYSYRGAPTIRWGGTYRRRADDMHFEIIVPRGTALAAVAALQSHPAKPHPGAAGKRVAAHDAHRPGSRALSLTSPRTHGDDVTFVQHWIGERRCGKADGIFGPATKAGVQWYQEMRHLPVTGVCDRGTWRNMTITATF